MLQNQTLQATPNVTFSPGSAAGRKRSALQGGQQIVLFGQDRVPANHLAARANKKEQKTQDTFGQSSTDSSPSAILQSSLENRLQARLDVNGSPEYVLTWKHWDMLSGPPICALRASARRISDKDFGGWPTPQSFDATGGGKPRPLRYKGNAPSERGNTRNPNTMGSYRGDLKDYAALAGWPTARANDGTGAQECKGRTGGQSLKQAAQTAGWMTPKASDGDFATPRTSGRPMEKSTHLQTQAIYNLSGQTPSGSPAWTEKRGALNPNHSRWLMGYRAEWLCSEVLETLSSRR